MAEKDLDKKYTEFWSIKKDQTGALDGHVLLVSKHGLKEKSAQFASDNWKALGPVSCKEGLLIAQDVRGGALKEFQVLEKPSLLHKIGITAYGGVKRPRRKPRRSSSRKSRRSSSRKSRRSSSRKSRRSSSRK
jgi:hypothetical protein